jgi:hypothetical protein
MAEAPEPDRKQWGFAITESGVSRRRGKSFKDKVVKDKKWAELDTDALIIHPHPVGWNPGKLTKTKLTTILGLPSTTSDDELRAWMGQQVAIREIIRDLMHDAASKLQDGIETAFYKNPLATLQGMKGACHTPETNSDGTCKEPLALRDLQTVLHMFNKLNGDDDSNFKSQKQVEDEIRRRIRDELANHEPWEKDHAGVWHRNGFYCGCGRSV